VLVEQYYKILYTYHRYNNLTFNTIIKKPIIPYLKYYSLSSHNGHCCRGFNLNNNKKIYHSFYNRSSPKYFLTKFCSEIYNFNDGALTTFVCTHVQSYCVYTIHNIIIIRRLTRVITAVIIHLYCTLVTLQQSCCNV